MAEKDDFIAKKADKKRKCRKKTIFLHGGGEKKPDNLILFTPENNSPGKNITQAYTQESKPTQLNC